MTSLMYLNVYNCFILYASIHLSNVHALSVVYLLYLFECYPSLMLLSRQTLATDEVVLSLKIFEMNVGLRGFCSKK